MTSIVPSAATTSGGTLAGRRLSSSDAAGGVGPEAAAMVADPGGSEFQGGDGDDQFTGGPGPDIFRGGGGSDTLVGNGNDDQLYGEAGDDTLDGGDGDDLLDGGTGQDSMTGGAGDDTYWVDFSLEPVIEAENGGIDTVKVRLSYALGPNVENLILYDPEEGPVDSDTVYATGNGLDNDIIGNSADNSIDGGAGADRMEGGLGNDRYFVDNVGDVVVETLANGETDYLETTISFALTDSQQIENMYLRGSAAINGTGNFLDNRIEGNGAANRLDGGAGADALVGRAGDDTYIVDNLGDRIFEAVNEGFDTVYSSVNFTLAGQDIERLVLTGPVGLTGTGNSLANRITGSSGDDALYGMAGNDRLDGGAGADRLSGGDGDDVYFVDNAGDRALEASATGGMDTVYSSVSYTLAYQQIERLFLTGPQAIDATGNSLANTLVGNGNNNLLDGGTGADVMNGGAGNDTYIVDNAGDTVIEAAGGGSDTVRSSVTFYISNAYEIETLVLTGTAAINGYGNNLDNRIYGNSGNNVLNGRAGADIMSGGGGNDTYWVDNAGDRVVEGSGGGTDTINSSVSFNLAGIHVETLILTGSAALTGTGNSLANRIVGNTGTDTLLGLGGDDVLEGRGNFYGGAGDDTLISLSDHDLFYFDTALNPATNVDTIENFDTVGFDQIQLSRAIFTQVDAGVLAEDAFHTGTAAADAEDRIVYDSATGRIWYDADGTGGAAAILFAQVDAGTPLTNIHFFGY
jgi:Ca2+-binding RTX toxin-like protein